MNYKQFKYKYILLFLLILLIMGRSVWSTEQQRISILKSDDLTSTKRAISGVKSVITAEFPDAVFHEFLTGQSADKDKYVIDTIKSHIPTLIITVGTSSTLLAQKYFSNTPIVFSSVKYPLLAGLVESMDRPGKNITGASLDIPLEVQFRTMRDIIPKIKSIGVLYTDNTAPLIPPAIEQASKMDINFIAVKINESKDLPKAVDSLMNSCQGIWTVADPVLFNPQSTRYILLNTMRRGIPLMGFSRHVVESGALFALDTDHKGVGRQAGAIAVQIIKGANPSEIPISLVDVIWFHYNEKTASHIQVAIPARLTSVAKEVYR